jgi:hypothetical protein
MGHDATARRCDPHSRGWPRLVLTRGAAQVRSLAGVRGSQVHGLSNLSPMTTAERDPTAHLAPKPRRRADFRLHGWQDEV